MPTASEALAAGRAALSAGAWAEARAAFELVLAEEESPEALEGLSWAAWWLDDVDACLDARERAYRLFRETGDVRGAARMALWLGDDHLEFRGEEAVANGWFQRAARLLDEVEPSLEHGWLAAFRAHGALIALDTETAKRLGAEARELGRRLRSVDLEMFGLALEGRALVAEAEVEEGMRRLDEAAAAAVGGEYEDILPAGWTCCYLIHACEDVRDYDRAAQWSRRSEEFSRRAGIRFVNGACRAYYAGVLCRHGEWPEAERELLEAAERLSAARPFWRDEAVVRLGDVRRRQGRLEEARELFVQAEWHWLAQVGLAELALDEGDHATARDLAEGMLRRIPAGLKVRRADPLEIAIRAESAAGEHEAAASHLGELEALAEAVSTSPLRGAASFCAGLVAAGGGDEEGARRHFEDAVGLFATAAAPFEMGRARLELARALARLGRAEDAGREVRRALTRFEEIGAQGECDRARAELGRLGRGGTLTAREVEVLRLVAEGLGDKGIAERLTLSEHTVHRHLANIYAKLGCSSRAAAVSRGTRLQLL